MGLFHNSKLNSFGEAHKRGKSDNEESLKVTLEEVELNSIGQNLAEEDFGGIGNEEGPTMFIDVVD